MATLEQEDEIRRKLQENLDELVEIDPKSLVREEELGAPLSFSDGVRVFERTIQLFKDLAECDLDAVPHTKLNTANQQAADALRKLREVENFDPQDTGNRDPFQARDNLINNLQGQYDKYWNAVAPIVTYRTQKALDFDRLEREARGTVADLQASTSDFEDTKNQAIDEIDKALEEVRKAAAEAGVSQQAIHFKDEAEAREGEGRWWLRATVGFAVVILIYVIFFLHVGLSDLGEAATTAEIVAATLSRVTILSLLAFGLVWCARNFSRARHNVVVNRHRSNALSTFNTFVSAASDPQVKDTVLVEATRSVFAPQSSGYSDGKQDPRPRNGIVEVLNRLAGSPES